MTIGNTSTWRMREMTSTFGLIIEPNDSLSNANDLIEANESLRELLKEHGALLLRGFDLDVPKLEAVTVPFGSFVAHRATTWGNRESVTETTATVNTGARAFPWHRELGYAPFPPDILFFFCDRPAEAGGETFVSDGCAILDRLDDATRAFVLGNNMQYTYKIPRSTWPLVLEANDQETAHVGMQRLRARLPDTESLTWELAASGEEFDVCYSTPMVITTRWTKRQAFCNQVIIRMVNAPYTKLPDGRVFPPEVLQTLRQAADATAFPIEWRPSDMAIIDNSRMLHARGDVLDSNRRILARLCYAGF
jgi:alpha-ketoglutarate-dependent taurine dioxygenase